jgi:hypothetical protein
MEIGNNIFMSSMASELNTQKVENSASISAMKKAGQVQEDMMSGLLGTDSMASDVDSSAVKSLVAEISGKGQNLDIMA